MEENEKTGIEILVDELKTKKWYQSKTIILGISVILGSIAISLADNFDYKTATIAAIGAIGVYIRTLTNKGVTK